MPNINNLPETSNITDNDLFILWDAETETTRRIKASSLKDYFGSSTPIVPIKVEAENYSAMAGIQVENCSEGGQNVGFIEPGDWMEYRIQTTSGTYQFNFRIASPNNGTQFQVRLGSTVLTTVVLPNTGGFQSWQSVQSSPVFLPTGEQIIRIHSLSTGWNINWFEYLKV